MPTFTPKTVTLPPLTANPTTATGNAQYLYGNTNPILAPLSGYLGNATSADTGTAYAPTVGDLVGIVGGVASAAGNSNAGQLFRAEDTVWNSTILQTQKDFVSQFLGVAAQSLRVAGTNGALQSDRVPFGNSIPQGAPAGGGGTGAPNPGNSAAAARVATSGVWQYPCASATFKVGDLVGPARAGVTNFLLSQKVVAVATLDAAVGVVVEAGTSITAVKIKILSSVLPSPRHTPAT